MSRLQTITLIAARPPGIPSVWLFFRVFGVLQWFLFFAVLMSFVAAMTMSLQLTKQVPGESWSNFFPTSMGRAYLFTLQLGEHPEVRMIGLRLQSLVLSLFTLMMFIYYTGVVLLF